MTISNFFFLLISVFDAGNLTYIDYDSRNVTFNKLAPAAFQVGTFTNKYVLSFSLFRLIFNGIYVSTVTSV